MISETVYFLAGGIVIILSVISVFVAKFAISRGLTYSTLAATVWALVFFAITRLWHASYEIFGLEETWGKVPELIEYILFVITYLAFIFLIFKAKRAKA